jgi:acyl-CoA synthetase (AMP-forming)/AMP-acid ligase II
MNSFLDILRTRTQDEPDSPAFSCLAADGTATLLTRAGLELRARALAAVLQDAGAAGEPVLILLQPGVDYLVSIFACMMAGVVMTPCAVPRRSDRTAPLRAIARDSGAKFAIGHRSWIDDPDFPEMRWIAPEDARPEYAACWKPPALAPDDLALLQYTSGSTAAARGVMVTHANLLENATTIAENFCHPPGFWGVTWLPPYHDMGLIGGILQPVYFNAPTAVIPPLEFARRPSLWLEAISRYRARTCGGPNFAYELCARAITPEESAGFKLDCWKLAYVGAEPIRADTLDLFARRFEPCGFSRESFFPCYGLAEATLYVSGGATALRHVSGSALIENRVVEKTERDADTRVLVSCGPPASRMKVVIVDQDTGSPCPPGSVGEIWVSGDAVARGYRNKPEETRATFEAILPGYEGLRFLRTGDLGFLLDGELFVTGRSKDLIIIRARNHYPQDIENTIAGVSTSIRPASYAAFSVDSETEEKLVVVLEMPRPRPANLESFAGDIRQAVAAAHDLQLFALALTRPGGIPRTSSGKIQRLQCRAQYISGALQGVVL